MISNYRKKSLDDCSYFHLISYNNNDDDNNNNNNSNSNNGIQRHTSRFSTIFSLRLESSSTRTLKSPGRNRVRITSSAHHVQHVMLRATWYEGTAQLLRV